MKILFTVSRYLLGLIFTVFGLNGFLHFIPATPPKLPLAVQWFTVMSESHYLVVVFAVQLLAGVLLLSGRFVPLALAMLAPELVNILNFHVLLAPEGLGLALVTTILWVIVFVPVREAFAGLLTPTLPRAAGRP